MRKISKVSTLIAVVGISLAAGLAPASADTVNSTVSGASLSASTAAPALSAVTLNGTSTQGHVQRDAVLQPGDPCERVPLELFRNGRFQRPEPLHLHHHLHDRLIRARQYPPCPVPSAR